MAEVPNLKDYIRRMSGGGGNSAPFSAQVDLLGNGVQPFDFAPSGATIEDLNNVYMPQIQARMLAIMAADPEMDPNQASAQAIEEVFAGAVFAYEVLFKTLASQLETLSERVSALEGGF